MELCCQENWKNDCSKLSCYMDPRDEVVSIRFSAFDPLVDIYIDTFSFSRRDDKFVEFVKSLNLKSLCYYSIAYRLARTKCPSNAEPYDFMNHQRFIMSYLNWSYGSPLNKDNYLKKQIEANISHNVKRSIKNKYTNRVIKVRNGQNTFRKDLIDYYGCCQLCGLKNHEILIASHSKPFTESEDDEAINFYNGLLLCPNYDKLYDKGLISFDDEGNILISSELSSSDKNILNLENVNKLELEPEHIEFIQWHRDNIFRK